MFVSYFIVPTTYSRIGFCLFQIFLRILSNRLKVWRNLNFLVLLFKSIMHNSCKTNIDIEEASKFSLSEFKLRAALKLCIDLFFAEWCWTLFSSTNSIINRSRHYFTRLKMSLRKETFIDQIHRDAYLTFQENSWN